MQLTYLRQLLEAFQAGAFTVEQVVNQLKTLPYENLNNYAHLDHHRALRTGFPEVIFAEGKTPTQIEEIFKKLAENNDQILVTRLSKDVYAQIQTSLSNAIYDPTARILYLDKDPERERLPGILILTAGTADIPIAEEAAITAWLMGNTIERLYDVGISGIHRLLSHLPLLQQAHVIIAVAGMEGALPSVLGGLVAAPIIAVPTSVGYGANFHGVAALLTMLNSCSSGVGVMNIDNGFGAGVLASKINQLSR